MAHCETSRKPARIRQLTWILAVFCAVLVLDQASKAIIRAAIPANSVSIAGRETEFFYFTHERNPGLVGGMFHDSRVVAYSAPMVATLVLLYLFRHLHPTSRLQSVAYGLVLGGALGNIIDRFRQGWVTDFLQFNFYFIPFDFPWKRYPAFNVADASICIGVFLLVLTWHRLGEKPNVSRPD